MNGYCQPGGPDDQVYDATAANLAAAGFDNAATDNAEKAKLEEWFPDRDVGSPSSSSPILSRLDGALQSVLAPNMGEVRQG